MITFDIETKDPLLETKGPGVYRKDGFVLGVSIKREGEKPEYFSFAHDDTCEEDRRKNRARVKELLGTKEEKLAANAQYDIEWLQESEGIPVLGKVHDVQIAEPLIDEYAASYSVGALAEKYLKEHKGTDEIQAFCDRQGWKGPAQKHLWKMPSGLVGRYANKDTEQEEAIFKKQRPVLAAEGLDYVYDMEVRLTPLLLLMRRVGARVDRIQRTRTAGVIKEKFDVLSSKLFEEYGEFNFNSSPQIAKRLDMLGLPYPKTEIGNPSVGKDILEGLPEHPFIHDLLLVREMDKIYNSFVMGSFLEYDIDGRIHCSFYPLRKDEGGTVSGRFSSRFPNLQQVPGKDDEKRGGLDFKTLVRSIFIPEEGCFFGHLDYSQVEYRTICHYARGPKSEEIRDMYRTNPHTDFHQLVIDFAKALGYDITRGDAKRINFGFAYFMGVSAMERKFHWEMSKAEQFVKMYNTAMPFMKPTRTAVVQVARGRGYIKTLLGRRSRVSEKMRAEEKEYSMFNRLIQGTAADINKKGMLDAWDSGLFDLLVPHLTVHDEIDVSVPKTRAGLDAFRELQHTMETCMDEVAPLSVPLIAEAELGGSWGTGKEIGKEASWEDFYAKT